MPATNLFKDNQVLLLRSILEEPMYQIASPFPSLVLFQKRHWPLPSTRLSAVKSLFFSSCPYLLRLFSCCGSFSSTNTPLDLQISYCIYFSQINERRHSGLMNENFLFLLVSLNHAMRRSQNRNQVISYHKFCPDAGTAMV
jgi:hypothetical protein